VSREGLGLPAPQLRMLEPRRRERSRPRPPTPTPTATATADPDPDPDLVGALMSLPRKRRQGSQATPPSPRLVLAAFYGVRFRRGGSNTTGFGGMHDEPLDVVVSGFRSKWVSLGVTAEGTTKRALRPAFAQLLPMLFSASGPGVARQSMGKLLASSGRSCWGARGERHSLPSTSRGYRVGESGAERAQRVEAERTLRVNRVSPTRTGANAQGVSRYANKELTLSEL